MNTAKRRLYLGMLKVLNLGLMVMAFGIATVLEVQQQGGGVTLSEFLSMRVRLVTSMRPLILQWTNSGRRACRSIRFSRIR